MFQDFFESFKKFQKTKIIILGAALETQIAPAVFETTILVRGDNLDL